MKLRYLCFILLLCCLLVFNACSTNSVDPAEPTMLESEPKVPAVWDTLYYEDEFGDVSDYAYLSNSIDGKYRTPSSSSDTDATVVLEHHFAIGNDSLVSFFKMSATLKGGKNKKEIRGPMTIKLKIDEEVYTERLRIASNHDICIGSYDEDTKYVYQIIYDALISGEDVKVYLEDYDKNVYTFTIESGNFKDAIESIYPQYQE